MNTENLATAETKNRVQPYQEKRFLVPAVNIRTDKDGYVLEAEMPGVNKDGLEILLEGEELTIIGHRKVAPVTGDVLYKESSDRDYQRNFVLDPAIDTAKITARIDNGLLTLTLPRAEKVKPRKITVE